MNRQGQMCVCVCMCVEVQLNIQKEKNNSKGAVLLSAVGKETLVKYTSMGGNLLWSSTLRIEYPCVLRV